MRAAFLAHNPIYKVPEPPSGTLHIWNWFMELSASRGDGMNGPAALQFQDVWCWSQLTGVTPSPLEISLIMLIDISWRAEFSRLMKIKTGP